MRLAIRFAALGTVALVAALAAWSVGGEPSDADDRRLRIATMTESERSQLIRKYNDFQRLAPETRMQIQQMHAAVENEPRLRRTLLEYQKFVSTLDPLDQTELREMATDERLARVTHLVERRSKRRESPRRSGLGGRVPSDWIYGPAEFDEAMQILAESLGLPESQRQELEALPAHQRHLRIARQAADKIASGGRSPSWPDVPTVNRLLNLFPDGWLKNRIRDNDSSDDRRRNAVVGLLMRSLYAEWQTQALEVIPSSELQAALEKLPERRQAELQLRDPGELLRQVVHVIAEGETGSSEFAQQFEDVTDLWRRFDRFSRSRRGDRNDRGDRDDRPGRRRGPPDEVRREGDRRDPPPRGDRNRRDTI